MSFWKHGAYRPLGMLSYAAARPNGILAPMVTCPHCKDQTKIPGGFDSIDVGRFTCEQCRSEFLIIDNVPMTEEQYRQGTRLQ
jgi:transposase-like protein